MQLRRICLFKLDSTQEIYIPSNGQETSLQPFTHVFSLEVKMVEILTDLFWKLDSENIRPLQKVKIPCSSSTIFTVHEEHTILLY